MSPGLNKLEWRYDKDNTVNKGADCAWIDLIDFAESSPVLYIKNDIQVAKIINPVQKEKYGFETLSVLVKNHGN